MKRLQENYLTSWIKRENNRKPLLLLGARQVGKTHLVRQMGQSFFRKLCEFNFEEDQNLKILFEKDLDPQRILAELSFRAQHQIQPGEDLLFFDEIQAAPLALTSLKYFREKFPTLAVCGAGSLLGLQLSPASFPVGQVEFLKIYPLTFREFLWARSSPHIVEAYEQLLSQPGKGLESLNDTLWKLWLEYLIVGGLPETIVNYLKSEPGTLASYDRAREIQRTIMQSYLADIAKHAGKVNATHIERTCQSVSAQLAMTQDESTQKFKFKDVVPGVHTYARLASAIDWLKKAGMIYRLPICEHAETPITAFTKENLFKLFQFDVGVLGAMLALPPAAIYAYNFGTFKGFLVENFVLQELMASNHDEAALCSWQEGTAEVEFLLQGKTAPVPVEVKSGHRVKAKSLQSYRSKYRPSCSIVISAKSYSKTLVDHETRIALPLYMTSKVWDFLAELTSHIPQ